MSKKEKKKVYWWAIASVADCLELATKHIKRYFCGKKKDCEICPIYKNKKCQWEHEPVSELITITNKLFEEQRKEWGKQRMEGANE